MYCVKCKRNTDTIDLHPAVSKNNRNMLKGTCSVCGRIKNQFVAHSAPASSVARSAPLASLAKPATAKPVTAKPVTSVEGGDLTNSINKFTSKIKLPWAKFPGEMHIPGMNFAGPGTNLAKRLTSTDAFQEWSKPVDRVDNAAYHHDLAYKYYNDKQTRNLADQMMLEEMNAIQNPTQREINERKIIEPIISAKAKFGLGVSLGSIKNPDAKALKKNTSKKKMTRK